MYNQEDEINRSVSRRLIDGVHYKPLRMGQKVLSYSEVMSSVMWLLAKDKGRRVKPQVTAPEADEEAVD